MASVNKVILLGNCGRDPEVRYLPSGQAVANVSIATSSKRKDKASGETIEDTQWHRVTFYDRLAEIAGEYVKKGRPIYVEGRLKYGVYTDKTTGVEKNTVDIIATELQLLGGREGTGAPSSEDGGARSAPRPGRWRTGSCRAQRLDLMKESEGTRPRQFCCEHGRRDFPRPALHPDQRMREIDQARIQLSSSEPSYSAREPMQNQTTSSATGRPRTRYAIPTLVRTKTL